MNIKNFTDMKRLFLLLGGAALLWSCGSSNKGELTGVSDRPVFEDMDLAGMIFIDQGNFIMGGGGQDNVYGVTTPERTVQVVSFFMDETEITNNEYRQFVYYVRDSIARRLLGEAGVEGYLIEEDQYGEPIEPALLDNRTKINWDEQESREALEPMYLAEKDRFYRKRDIDPAKLNKARMLEYTIYVIDILKFFGILICSQRKRCLLPSLGCFVYDVQIVRKKLNGIIKRPQIPAVITVMFKLSDTVYAAVVFLAESFQTVIVHSKILSADLILPVIN